MAEGSHSNGKFRRAARAEIAIKKNKGSNSVEEGKRTKTVSQTRGSVEAVNL